MFRDENVKLGNKFINYYTLYGTYKICKYFIIFLLKKAFL